jgi:hypothetical protein
MTNPPFDDAGWLSLLASDLDRPDGPKCVIARDTVTGREFAYGPFGVPLVYEVTTDLAATFLSTGLTVELRVIDHEPYSAADAGSAEHLRIPSLGLPADPRLDAPVPADPHHTVWPALTGLLIIGLILLAAWAVASDQPRTADNPYCPPLSSHC